MNATNSTSGNFALSPAARAARPIAEAVQLIAAVGDKVSFLLQGHTGSGKTHTLKTLAKMFPDHVPCYFDCTVKDLGDISIPDLQTPTVEGGIPFVSFRPNGELGLQHGKPIILMIDEFMKAMPPVRNALLRVLLEREVGEYKLPEGSIVYATSNLSGEGMGDVLLPHQRDRLCVLQTAKPTAMEWIEDYAIPNNLHPMTIAFAKETPYIFQSFEEVGNPDDNPYIYHPRQQRENFVTHRSMEKVSDILYAFDDAKGAIGMPIIESALIGKIGAPAAKDLVTYFKLYAQLPAWDDIMSDPMRAKVPESETASALLAFKALTLVSKTMLTPWVTYMERCSKEVQGLFGNGVRSSSYPVDKQKLVFTNPKMVKWIENNQHLFTADLV